MSIVIGVSAGVILCAVFILLCAISLYFGYIAGFEDGLKHENDDWSDLK